MKPFSKDTEKRKQKDSFYTSAEDELESISSEIQEMFKSICFIEMLEEIRRDKFRVNNWFVYNFIVDTPIHEDLENQKSDLSSSKITRQKQENSKEDISSFDVIKGKDEVTVTVEMPDIREEDITLRVTKDTMKIMPDHPAGKYHKIINLPCEVKPRTLTFTYRNGILDIILKRGEKE